MEKILKIDNVSKSYIPFSFKALTNKEYRAIKTIHAVAGVSLEIESGEIYGLLGPNGAGKSTIIKMITGLCHKDSGSIIVGGHDIDKERIEASGEIGAIIETPSMFKNMNAIDNLRYFATLDGRVGESDIKRALDVVGLTKRAEDKVSTYSLGMKQRLGIAQAIMSKPKLLVLDEPTNGLDPEGIIDMRELIKKLAHELGVAVLVSSHILSEMQELCDRVGIIYQGQLVGETSIDELNSISKDSLTIACYTTNDSDKTFELIHEQYDKVVIKKGRVYVELKEGDIPEVTRMIVLAGVNIFSVDTKKRTLEDIFKALVEAKKRESQDMGGDDHAE